MAKPLLFGVPVYRGMDHVAESLRSIQEQSFTDYDVLISVDAGDEASAAVCRPFLADPRFRLVMQPARLHWAGNMNWLWAQNESDFFIYHQQDDLLHPDYAARLLALAAQHPDAAVTNSDVRYFGSRDAWVPGTSLDSSDPAERVQEQLHGMYWTALRGAVRREALAAAGPLRITEDESFGEDFAWAIGIARAGKVVRLPEPLYRKRAHANTISASWFGRWPPERRRRGLLTLCCGLLAAALPAAQTAELRFALLLEVLDRLVRRPFILPVKALGAEARTALIRDFFREMRRVPHYDSHAAFGLRDGRLELLALRRFGLASGAALRAGASGQPAGPDEQALLALAEAAIHRCLAHAPEQPLDLRQAAAQRHLQGAWGDAEADGVWTHGEHAEILLWPPPAGGWALTLEVRPLLTYWRAELRLEISVNGLVVANQVFTEADGDGFRDLQLALPAAALEPQGPLRISLRFPVLETHAALDIPDGAPIVGICLRRLTLSSPRPGAAGLLRQAFATLTGRGPQRR